MILVLMDVIIVMLCSIETREKLALLITLAGRVSHFSEEIVERMQLCLLLSHPR